MEIPERSILVAPFANERVREWPSAHYRRLIELILRHEGRLVTLVGTRAQRAKANVIARHFSGQSVINACGSVSWNGLLSAVEFAPYVVGNNSGIAHLAASRGRWTLCIFAASHSPAEWMPRGPRVVVMTKQVSCAPCAIGGDLCPNGVACMAALQPDDVYWRFERVRSEAAAEMVGADAAP